MNRIQNDERVEAMGDQLRAKITSKFTASTFLAGFALTILSGQVFLLWQSTILPLLFPLSVGIVAAAVVLFVEAVVRLDELTMPKRFWEENDDAGDTGHESREGYLLDDDLWELRKHMIFYWTKLTLVATWMTGLAVIVMLLPYERLPTDRIRWPAFIFILFGPAIGFAYRTIVIANAFKAKDQSERLRPLMRRCD